MTIAAEVARLAAVECLAPTAALLAETGFPTLAAGRVFDSRAAAVADLRPDGYLPSLALYTRKAESARRGSGQGSASRFGRTQIEIVAELSVIQEDENGAYADALLAGTDPQARIQLAALCAQVRHLLLDASGGMLFRRAVMAVEGIDFEPFAVPELGLRWHRTVMVWDCLIPDDDWGSHGGLPQPASALINQFPAESEARATLLSLAAGFAALPVLPVLETIAFAVQPAGASGQAGPADTIGPPFADVSAD